MELGILLSIISAICFGVSTAMQKYSLDKLYRFSIKGMLKSGNWLFSIAIGAVGIAMYVLSMKSVSVSTVQSVLTISILIPIFYGAFHLKERVGVIRWVSILAIFIGIFLTIL